MFKHLKFLPYTKKNLNTLFFIFQSPTRSQSGSKPGSPKARSPRKQSPSPTRKGSAKGSPTRPRSGKSPKRPESGKSPKRPESGKSLKRPESGKSDTKSNKSASPKTIKTSTPKDKKSDLEGKGTKEAAIKKKKTVEIKEPNETEDGLKIKNLSNQGLTRVPGPLLTGTNILYILYLKNIHLIDTGICYTPLNKGGGDIINRDIYCLYAILIVLCKF